MTQSQWTKASHTGLPEFYFAFVQLTVWHWHKPCRAFRVWISNKMGLWTILLSDPKCLRDGLVSKLVCKGQCNGANQTQAKKKQNVEKEKGKYESIWIFLLWLIYLLPALFLSFNLASPQESYHTSRQMIPWSVVHFIHFSTTLSSSMLWDSTAAQHLTFPWPFTLFSLNHFNPKRGFSQLSRTVGAHWFFTLKVPEQAAGYFTPWSSYVWNWIIISWACLKCNAA